MALVLKILGLVLKVLEIGGPLIRPLLTPRVVNILVTAAGVALSVVAMTPSHTIAHQVAAWYLLACGLLGIASAGVQPKEPANEPMTAAESAKRLG